MKTPKGKAKSMVETMIAIKQEMGEKYASDPKKLIADANAIARKYGYKP